MSNSQVVKNCVFQKSQGLKYCGISWNDVMFNNNIVAKLIRQWKCYDVCNEIFKSTKPPA